MLIPVLIGVTFIIFTLMYVTPGDPAKIILGAAAPQEEVDKLREELGLNDPFIIQYLRYLRNAVFHFDIGKSFITRRPVIQEIMGRFPTTLQLSMLGIIIAVLIGIPVGIISATRQYSIFDNISMVLALVWVSIPAFWLAILLILIFAVGFGWFPASGWGSFKQMVLPALTIGTGTVALIARMTRSSMLEVIRADYITTAKAKGQNRRKVVFNHALPNALIPIITIIGLEFGNLLGGAVLTESIFSISGIGRLMVESIKTRDLPMVEGSVLFVAIIYSVINLFVDVLYAYVDPRIRSQFR
jgi:peptide/nickel transport system permease protein